MWSIISSVLCYGMWLKVSRFLGGYLGLVYVKTVKKRKGACIRVWSLSYLLYQCCYGLRIPNIIEVVNNTLYVLLFLLSFIASSIQVVAKQVWQCTPGKQVGWNLLSLFATSAMLFLEISIVAFLLKENYASCLETLARTFMVSGLFVGVDLLLKVQISSFCFCFVFWLIKQFT